MHTQGYYRHPTIFGNQIVFVSEDDLWSTSLEGDVARRLTTGAGSVSSPAFSPDGKWIAFSGSLEGHSEVYLMPSEGGETKRLTFLGDMVQILCWKGDDIYFSSTAAQPFARVNVLWKVSSKGGTPERLPLGPGNTISFKGGKSNASVIQRHGYREYGFWKRYRGGTAGEIWVDEKGTQDFKKLIQLKSDMAQPLWVGGRIYFASDHEGVGNLYSCMPSGKDLKRHTHHTDYYVRNGSTDGKKIVYHAGGDLYVFDPETDQATKVDFLYHSARHHRNRKFVNSTRYLQGYALHPKGHHVGVISRGKPFTFGNWEGPAFQLGDEKGVRYRLLRWLADGKRVLLVSDQDGDERLEIYDVETCKRKSVSPKLDLGRVSALYVNPVKDEVILVNHRSELIHIHLKTWKIKTFDRSKFSMIDGVTWSPDGEWVAYNCSLTRHQSAIKLFNVKSGKVTQVSRPILRDVCPAFDPEGKYLYFLSYREFHPEWDSLHFELGFPCGMRPYLVTLQKDLTSPFQPNPKDLGDESGKGEAEDSKESKKKEKKPKLKIDLAGIQDRVRAFPIESGMFSQIVGVKGKVLFLSWPLVSASEEGCSGSHDGILESFDFETQKCEELAHGVRDFELSLDHETLLARFGRRLRVLKAGEKIDERGESKASPKSGWIDLSRVRVSVDPVSEWEQIYKEAWRLQRDHFWVTDMSKVDWERVFDRYWPLIGRISNRAELSDVVWEMQGELGTSHAYVVGGDVEHPPQWRIGSLAADLVFDGKRKAYKIENIVRGDSWNPLETSPLTQPGVNVSEGDLIWQVNGRDLSADVPPEAILVHLAGQEVRLQVSDSTGKKKRSVTVKTLYSQGAARYREWVEKNRAYVHKKTKGRVGYIHIPDMGAKGFAEFHRGFLMENDREGLVVDVRFNGGGSVSPLILEKLARRRLGYDVSRWFGDIPYPEDSPAGPLVALTNEYAGSDGDIFSHGFKMMKLGPLIGKRTWGGVIGIWPRNTLVDGGYTTQPEFSFWFFEGGWGIENHGADPDIVVENKPQDEGDGKDAQLDRSIAEVLKLLKGSPPQKPDFSGRPRLGLPKKLEGA